MSWGDPERPHPREDQGARRSREDEIHQEAGLLRTAALPSRQPWEQFSFLGTLSTSRSTTQQVLGASSRLSHQNTINESFMPGEVEKSFIMNQEGDGPLSSSRALQASGFFSSSNQPPNHRGPAPHLPATPTSPCSTPPAPALTPRQTDPLASQRDRTTDSSGAPRLLQTAFRLPLSGLGPRVSLKLS